MDETIMLFLEDLMKLLSTRLGCGNTIVLIDEFDTPLTHSMCIDTSAAERESTKNTLIRFYSYLLKGNNYLEKGILVGIIDVSLRGAASGLNSLTKYFPHSGIVNYIGGHTPFQNALGFNECDVRGLIEHFVSNDWAYRDCCVEHGQGDYIASKTDIFAARNAFGSKLYEVCIRRYNGYRVGSSRHVFNPNSVVRFLEYMRHCREVPETHNEITNFWMETGDGHILQCLKVADSEALRKFINYAVVDYDARFYNQFGIPPPSTRKVIETEMSQRELDGSGVADILLTVDEIISHSHPEVQLSQDLDMQKRLANACMTKQQSPIDSLSSSSGLPPEVVMRLLYQNGYLTPLAVDHVGIPNEEVYESILPIFRQIAENSGSLSTNPYQYQVQELGLLSGDMARFANFLSREFTSMLAFDVTAKEAEYQRIIQVLIQRPVENEGYKVVIENRAEAGRMDILVSLADGYSSQQAADKPYIIIELKKLTESEASDSDSAEAQSERGRETTGRPRRRRGARRAKGAMRTRSSYAQQMEPTEKERRERRMKRQTQQAMDQVNHRYLHSALNDVHPGNCVHTIGICFWRNRFYMIASRVIKPSAGSTGRHPYDPVPYTESDFADRTGGGVDFRIENGQLNGSNAAR
ncbi:hypothetical protein GQ54DRAFT_116051 [Martensiomyces pterosporus]|nr:hypothetical protein GQ54DRAFT_116051 [Martensiomyces pterosporus]